ncbi:hypothetical protein ABIE65_002666 [Constrictibacter sp. MBR-5]|jgi:hypothetical protein
MTEMRGRLRIFVARVAAAPAFTRLIRIPACSSNAPSFL